MTTRFPGAEHPDWRRSARGPNGRHLCKRCLTEVPKGRLYWCGAACVDDHLQKSSASGMRRAVEARDHGVCAACGRDTEALRQSARGGDGCRFRYYPAAPDDSLRACGCASCLRAVELRAEGWPRDADRSWWEADHIVAVIEGGGPELSNLRTLCVPCHKRETAALAKRRADARRGQLALA